MQIQKLRVNNNRLRRENTYLEHLHAKLMEEISHETNVFSPKMMKRSLDDTTVTSENELISRYATPQEKIRF
jgi:hypothetical protein